jgi:hypothetical protein
MSSKKVIRIFGGWPGLQCLVEEEIRMAGNPGCMLEIKNRGTAYTAADVGKR